MLSLDTTVLYCTRILLCNLMYVNLLVFVSQQSSYCCARLHYFSYSVPKPRLVSWMFGFILLHKVSALVVLWFILGFFNLVIWADGLMIILLWKAIFCTTNEPYIRGPVFFCLEACQYQVKSTHGYKGFALLLIFCILVFFAECKNNELKLQLQLTALNLLGW